MKEKVKREREKILERQKSWLKKKKKILTTQEGGRLILKNDSRV